MPEVIGDYRVVGLKERALGKGLKKGAEGGREGT